MTSVSADAEAVIGQRVARLSLAQKVWLLMP
jgi:hypothetical protein